MRGIFQTPLFPQTMSRNIFQLIQRYLHFIEAGTNEDRLYKIRTILDIVVNNFRTNFIPDREISLDECMPGWRGRLRFRVYNPSKITKYGILVRMVCESSTGYTGCPRRNVPDFGRVFLMLRYTDITQNTYIQS